MGRISTVRAGIRAAIGSCPGLSAVPVIDASDTRYVEALAKEKFPAPCIVVVWDGVEDVASSHLGARAPQDQRHGWVIVIAVGEYRSDTGSTDRAGRGLEEIYESLMDNDTGIRTRAVATFSDESVYLVGGAARLELPPDRGPEGGRAFLVTRWKTTETLG